MSVQISIQELEEIRAMALATAELATRLISRKEVVSTSSLSKKGKGLTEKQEADLTLKLRKRYHQK